MFPFLWEGNESEDEEARPTDWTYAYIAGGVAIIILVAIIIRLSINKIKKNNNSDVTVNDGNG